MAGALTGDERDEAEAEISGYLDWFLGEQELLECCRQFGGYPDLGSGGIDDDSPSHALVHVGYLHAVVDGFLFGGCDCGEGLGQLLDHGLLGLDIGGEGLGE